jgi:hypothetical protein
MKTLLLKTLGDVAMRLLILVDILINRLFNGRVETISSRAARARKSDRTWGCVLCALLDRIQLGHCDKAMQDPLGRLE